MDLLKNAIRKQIFALVGRRSRSRRVHPEDGLFPPDAVCRKVHADFMPMMVGGISALLLQMLHPAALAGVWDHSDFREDMQGRLRRTADFISVTTFGSIEEAEAAIDRVRRVHHRVRGSLPDGSPYRADDPDLLTWVHVAGAASFLRAYLRYRAPLSRAAQDSYFAETADIAHRLGAELVPATVRDVGRYFEEIRPRLRADARTREVRRLIVAQAPSSPALIPFHALAVSGGIELLPDWAARMHGLRVPALGRLAVRLGTAGAAGLVRWALRS